MEQWCCAPSRSGDSWASTPLQACPILLPVWPLLGLCYERDPLRGDANDALNIWDHERSLGHLS